MGCFKLLNCWRNKKCTYTVNNSNSICVSDLLLLIPRRRNQSADYPETTFKASKNAGKSKNTGKWQEQATTPNDDYDMI